MNGFGSNALDMVGALEKLTKVQQLGILTLASIKEVVPLRYLLKNYLSWCSVCYEEQLNNGDTIYNLLLWNLEMVNTCSKHKCKLETGCFLCHKKFRFYAGKAKMDTALIAIIGLVQEQILIDAQMKIILITK